MQDDLRALGTVPVSLPPCSPPPISGRAEAMGSVYVMEGSTLGGRVILKRLGGLGLPSGICTYFTGYGAETGAMSTAFLQPLEAEPDPRAVLRGAKATFATLGDWMLGTALS